MSEHTNARLTAREVLFLFTAKVLREFPANSEAEHLHNMKLADELSKLPVTHIDGGPMLRVIVQTKDGYRAGRSFQLWPTPDDFSGMTENSDVHVVVDLGGYRVVPKQVQELELEPFRVTED